MPGYVPPADPEFDAWQEQWVTYALANAGALGIGLPEAAALTASRTAWNAGYDAHVVAQAAAEAARQQKEALRASHEALLRQFSQRLQARAETADVQRAGLGITVPDREPTLVPPPSTAPLLNIVTAERLRHVLEASKTPAEGGGLGKPVGVRGVQIWRKVGGPPPAGEADLTFAGEFTRTRITLDYAMGLGGQTVHYQARWVSTRGAVGPWGELASASVVQ